MNQRTNAKREFPYVALILIVTLVLVVAIVGYSVVDSIGLISQLSTSGKSDNFKFNENITDVYRFVSGQQTFSEYYQYLYYYLYMYQLQGLDQSTALSYINSMDPMGGTFAQYISAGKSADEYIYDHIATYLPLGMLDSSAYNVTESVLTYCEGATEEGLYDTYEAEIAEDVEESIEGMKDAAKSLGVSFSTFRTRYIGNGVSEKDIRKALTYQYIAAKYAETLNDRYSNGATVSDAETWRDEHKEDFYMSSYYSLDLFDKTLYDAVKDLTSLDAVTEAIANYYFEKNFAEQYAKYFSVKDKEVEDADKEQTKKDILSTILAMNGLGDKTEVFTEADGKGEDAYKKAARQTAEGINTSTTTNKTSLKAEVEKITKRAEKDPTEVAYVDISVTSSSLTDLQKWLFQSTRKTGDFKAITTTSTSSSSSDTTTITYTFYIAADILKWDTEEHLEHTKDVFYVQLTDDATEAESGETAPADPKTAAEKAQLMYDALKGITDEDEFADKFAELIEQYEPTATDSTAIRENVSESTLTDANLQAWIYNPLRKPGDLAILPLSADKKAEEDAAADAETETEVETEAETEAETDAETDTETGDKKEEDKKDSTYLVYFVAENRATWEEEARAAIASEKLNAWYEETLEKYHVTVNYEFETESETTAATSADNAETAATTEATTEAETEGATEDVTEAATEGATEDVAAESDGETVAAAVESDESVAA